MTIAQRFAVLFALAGSGVGLYLVTGTGAPTTEPAAAARVCGLPPIGPAAFYTALAVPMPTGPDGAGTGDCLPPDDAEDLARKARIAAALLPKWRAASLTSTQCAAGIIAVEFGEPFDGGASAQHEELVQVCGPAPSATSTATIERMERLPGTAVRLLDTYGPYARNGEPVIRRWVEGTYPPAADAIWTCACRPTSDVAGGCLARSFDGGMAPAPFGVELGQGRWSGAVCKRKPCGESLEVQARRGRDYSMPPECTVPPDPAPYVPPAPDGGLP